MNTKRTFGMLAAAALLASCSQNDALQNTVDNNEGLKPMTLTVSLPEGGMQTRAEGDAAATRCYVQIFQAGGTELGDGNSDVKRMEGADGSFTTTVYLKGDEAYDFLFWADTEAEEAAAPTDLTAVAYNNGQTIAWTGNELNEQWSAAGIDVTLKHVVSRVTVKTETEFTVSTDWPLTVTVPTVCSTYNVAAGAGVKGSEVSGGYTFEALGGDYEAEANVGHFYVLGNGSTQKLVLHYNGPRGNSAVEINEVPVSADTHITLTGDICNAGLVSGCIKATATPDWGSEETEDFGN